MHDIHLAAGFYAKRVAIYGALAAARPVAMPVRNCYLAAIDVTTVTAQGQIHWYAVVTEDADVRAVFFTLQLHRCGGAVDEGFHLDVGGYAPAFG